MPFFPIFSSKDLDGLTSNDLKPNIHELDNLLQKIETDKAAMASEIEELESIISDYRKRIRVLEDCDARRIRYHRSALSRFPREILELVFEQICFENSFASRETVYTIILGQVCSLWRSTVYHHGRCWSTFHVCGPCHYRKMVDTKRKRMKKLTKLFLARAVNAKGKLPLNMRIECETLPSSTMELLLNEIHRWSEICLIGPNEHFEKPEFAMNYLRSIPLLRSLSISVRSTSSQTGPHVLMGQFNNFSAVPAGVLRSLCLFDHLPPSGRSNFPHWRCLTALELHLHAPEHILATLRLCVNAGANLESVTLRYIEVPHEDSKSEGQIVTLSSLRYLGIYLGSTRNELRCRDLPKHLLSKLTLPTLTVLKIHAGGQEGRYDNRWMTLDDVEEFFVRSEFPLEELSLHEVGIDDTQLMHLIQHVSETVKMLSIVETTSGTPGAPKCDSLEGATSIVSLPSVPAISDSFPSSLEMTETLSTAFLLRLNSTGRFLPKLRELYLTRSSGLRFNRKAFVDVVRSRSATSLRLDRERTMVSLTKVALRIRLPNTILPKGRRGNSDVDPFNYEIYRLLRLDNRIYLKDDDPKGEYEKERKDEDSDLDVSNDEVDSMSSSGYFGNMFG